MTDFTLVDTWLAPIGSLKPMPVDEVTFRDRLRLTALSFGHAVLGIPVALALAILTILAVPLGLVAAGVAIAWLAVPATEALANLHRQIAGGLLEDEIYSGYADTTGSNAIIRPLMWVRDPARWRDFGYLCFSATGGFVLSMLPVALLTSPLMHVLGVALDGGRLWWLLLALDGPLLVTWWLVTPHLVRARALADRGILGHSRVEQLEQRVEEVTASRSETLDHAAAEVRRIERDLHDGAQTQMLAVGMNVGMAEKLLAEDPAAAAEILREARENTLGALASMRDLIRGIHPPALADGGLVGGIEALTHPFPVPVVLRLEADGHAPPAVESAMYFAVAECLVNVVKHAAPERAWVTMTHADGRLRIEVGDDGVGGADPNGSGIEGIRRRLAAFDGTITVTSPTGGPTIAVMEVPCELSSQRISPFSGSD